MALQSSGQISINDIKTELGNSSGSLATLSTAAGKSAPHAISEFYGYSALPPNDKYYSNDGAGDYINATTSTSPFSISSTQDLSVCMWVKPQNTSSQNHMIINFGNTNANGNNRMFISYTASVNRILTRYRSNSVNFDVQWALHDNSGVTGISSSTPAWSSTNRGSTNSDGWIMLTMTYDASQSSASNAFKLYWNDGAFSSQATSASGTRSTMDATKLRIGENLHLTDSGGNAHMDFDEIKIYDKVLSASEVTTLWNDGIALDSTATVDDGLITEWTFESGDASDSAGSYTNSITGGSVRDY